MAVWEAQRVLCPAGKKLCFPFLAKLISGGCGCSGETSEVKHALLGNNNVGTVGEEYR